jgi:hypothetical protein
MDAAAGNVSTAADIAVRVGEVQVVTDVPT